MLSATGYNRLVLASSRNQRLNGRRRFRAASGEHKWTVSIRPDLRQRRLEVFVGTGCVNDQPAAIEYRIADDPRTWLMPKDYGPRRALVRQFGEAYPFVDRPLWDDPEPRLLVTLPDASAQDLGGFVRTPDLRRPPFFRTAAMWERELYQASVVVTTTPYRADPLSVSLQTRGQRAVRWRVTAGRLPLDVSGSGVAAIATKELARIYLVRTPGRPELDDFYVDQRVFWNLRARSSINRDLLELLGATATAAVGVDIGLLALGLTGVTVGVALAGIEAALVDLILANLETILAATSGVLFWSV